MDPKAFMEGFLQYLQSYYGAAGTQKPSTTYPNKPRMPLFDGGTQKMPEIQFPELPQETGGDLSAELNTMFPRRDFTRMN